MSSQFTLIAPTNLFYKKYASEKIEKRNENDKRVMGAANGDRDRQREGEGETR